MEETATKIIMSNPEYIEWIEEFTKDKQGFSDEDIHLYKDAEKANIEKLRLFYRGLDTYAKANHIYPELNEFGCFYKVKYNNSGYQVGYFEGQGTTVYYLTILSLRRNKEFIDFNDVLSNKKQENVDAINKSLSTISNDIITAYNNGVPIEAIANTFNSTIERLTSKNDDETRKLINR